MDMPASDRNRSGGAGCLEHGADTLKDVFLKEFFILTC